MSYRHITDLERSQLSILRQAGHCQAEIARQLHRSKSTISRELRRNSCTDGRYRIEKASRYARRNKSISRRNLQITKEEWELVEAKLKDYWSPQQISNRFEQDGTLHISHESIYRLIKEDKARGGFLYTYLRCSRKLKRKRYGTYDRRGRLSGKRMIDKRPDDINQRVTLGHWEGDTVMGKGPDCLVTLVERKTRLTLIGKLNQHTVSEVNRVLCELLTPYRGMVKSITFDNGTEFHGYKELEEKIGCQVYFALPHHPWQRGTNENTNGLIRQFAPKRTTMFGLTQSTCNQFARRLNTRPRKALGYKTPIEALKNEAGVAL